MADVQSSGVAAPGAVATVAAAASGAIAPATAAAAGPAPAPSEAAAAPAAPLDKEKVKAAVKNANESLSGINTQLVFVLEDYPPHFAVKLLDIETQKVLQQIPSQAMPVTANALADAASSGTLIDASA